MRNLTSQNSIKYHLYKSLFRLTEKMQFFTITSNLQKISLLIQLQNFYSHVEITFVFFFFVTFFGSLIILIFVNKVLLLRNFMLNLFLIFSSHVENLSHWTYVIYELGIVTLLSTSSHSSVDGAPTSCIGGYEFESYQTLRFFLCPMLVTCWLIHLITHFITELKIHHLYFASLSRLLCLLDLFNTIYQGSKLRKFHGRIFATGCKILVAKLKKVEK